VCRSKSRMTFWEARFFFSQGPIQDDGKLRLDDVEIVSARVSDRSDEALRNYIGRVVGEDPALLEMTKTHDISVDVGVHKDSGGLGASHFEERILLYRATP